MSKVILDQPNPAELTNCRDPSSNPKAELPTQQMLFFLNLMHIRDIKDYTWYQGQLFIEPDTQ